MAISTSRYKGPMYIMTWYRSLLSVAPDYSRGMKKYFLKTKKKKKKSNEIQGKVMTDMKRRDTEKIV